MGDEPSRSGTDLRITFTTPYIESYGTQLNENSCSPSYSQGFLFGEEIVKQFNHANNLDLIARAHQLVMEGYKLMFHDALVTVWSAPNYCYRCGNVAAILELDAKLQKGFTVFQAAPQDGRNMPSKRVALEYFL